MSTNHNSFWLFLKYLNTLNDSLHLSYLVLLLTLYFKLLLLWIIIFTYCLVYIGVTLDCQLLAYSLTVFDNLLLTHLYCWNYLYCFWRCYIYTSNYSFYLLYLVYWLTLYGQWIIDFPNLSRLKASRYFGWSVLFRKHIKEVLSSVLRWYLR